MVVGVVVEEHERTLEAVEEEVVEDEMTPGVEVVEVVY